MTATTTTVNIHGPTVSDFKAVFSPQPQQTIQLQTTQVNVNRQPNDFNRYKNKSPQNGPGLNSTVMQQATEAYLRQQ